MRFKRTPYRMMKRRPRPNSGNPMMRQPRMAKRTRNFRATGQYGHQQLNIIDDDQLYTLDEDELAWSVDPDVTQPYVYA